MSFPTAKVRSDLEDANVSPSNSSRKATGLAVGFGTSIPTAAFPGIGASIRTLVAAILNLISSAKFVILLTRTPCSGKSSYLVTVGPQITAPIFTLTLKLFNVS